MGQTAISDCHFGLLKAALYLSARFRPFQPSCGPLLAAYASSPTVFWLLPWLLQAIRCGPFWPKLMKDAENRSVMRQAGGADKGQTERTKGQKGVAVAQKGPKQGKGQTGKEQDRAYMTRQGPKWLERSHTGPRQLVKCLDGQTRGKMARTRPSCAKKGLTRPDKGQSDQKGINMITQQPK